MNRNARKVRTGRVISAKMNKTIVVKIERTMRHPLYGKVIKQFMKLYAHDEKNDANQGDSVRVMETRPLSSLKRWRLVDIIERAK